MVEWEENPVFEGHPDRYRFAAISAGLSLIEVAKRAAVQIEGDAWDGTVRSGLGGVLWHAEAALRAMRQSPPGRDGTGKDLGETLRAAEAARDRLHTALRTHAATARGILRREVAEQLPLIEQDLKDEDEIRWMVEEVPEELGLVLSKRWKVVESIRWLEELGDDVSEDRRRLAACDGILRAHGVGTPDRIV